MSYSASTATIVRIPYLSSLSNKSDFLHATTDVAIWSACETGLAITAASTATLRPLFRTFLSRRHLFGNSLAGRQAQSSPWPRPGPGPHTAGYIRRHSEGGVIDPESGFGTNPRDKHIATATSEVDLEEPNRTVLDSRGSSRSDTRMIGVRNHVVNLMRGS